MHFLTVLFQEAIGLAHPLNECKPKKDVKKNRHNSWVCWRDFPEWSKRAVPGENCASELERPKGSGNTVSMEKSRREKKYDVLENVGNILKGVLSSFCEFGKN